MLENRKWRVWSSNFKCEPMLLDEMTQRLVQEFQPEQVILAGLMLGGRQIKLRNGLGRARLAVE